MNKLEATNAELTEVVWSVLRYLRQRKKLPAEVAVIVLRGCLLAIESRQDGKMDFETFDVMFVEFMRTEIEQLFTDFGINDVER